MNGVSQVYVEVGWNGLFAICLTLGCVALAWVLLQEVRWEKLLRHHLSPRAKLLQLALAVIIGHQVARFVLDYANWAGALKWLFRSG